MVIKVKTTSPKAVFRNVDWKPYTVKDYRKIKPDTYYELGGLGAFNIGSEDWRRRK
jgi:hypothetical protein